MSFTIETTKTGKPCILFENVKYRQHRVLKSDDVSWRCLGKNCGASIKTDANKTTVTVCNQKHSGEHPVTMRSLLSPLLQPRTATAAAGTSSPLPAPATPSATAPASPPVYSTPAHAISLNTLPTPEASEEEIHIIRNKFERLEEEYKKLLNHTIESDTRLLQFTDQIFPVSVSPRDDQTARASATVDCGVQCEVPPASSPALVDSGVQCDLQEQPTCMVGQCTENIALIKSLKTTMEVLTAENQCLKLQLEKFECAEPWTEVKGRNKQKIATSSKPQEQVRGEKTPIASNQKVKNKKTKQKNIDNAAKNIHKVKNPKVQKITKPQLTHANFQSSQTCIPHYTSITVRGDSHARHIAGMVMKLTGPRTSISGMCMPGARLLNIIRPDQTSPDPGPRCEVLIAGTNDLAVGEQRKIYRHLENYIVARPAGTELLLATLPHRHDLDLDHPVHVETVLVNAFVEELAARHNVRLLKIDEVGRRYFTRHGQHLSMRGKRMLAGMIVRALASSSPETPSTSLESAPAAIASSPLEPVPTEVVGDSTGTLQPSPNLQRLSYADTVRGLPSDGLDGRSPVSKT
ncbi:hypothetical protein J6590_082667 [Homalodisca vitripennis]|nr:hypothetical protein J6590_082667 [Homalodisca vitripennis]